MSKIGTTTKKIWDFLGSRDLSVFIFIMGLTYTLFLVIFGMFIPVSWVSRIAKLLPFKVLYILFFINLIICEIKWIPVILRRCKKPKIPQSIEDFQRFRHKIRVQGAEFSGRGLQNYLRLRGYKVTAVGGQQSASILHAFRGRFSPLGNLLFHLSFIILLTGVLISMLFRFEGTMKVIEKSKFTGNRNEYQYTSFARLATLPRVGFFLEKITPRFWEGKLLFTELRADVRHRRERNGIWLSAPLKMDGANITLKGLGLTPRYILKDNTGKDIDAGYVNLAIFAPGTEDHFQIPGFPYQIFVSFYPDSGIKNGKLINRSMEPKNPAYLVKIYRGRIPVYSGPLKPGEEAAFEGLRLSFNEYIHWGEFAVIKDPGVVFIWTAFVLFLTGLAWRLFLYRREVILIKEEEGLYLYGLSDYYTVLFEKKMERMTEVLKGGIA